MCLYYYIVGYMMNDYRTVSHFCNSISNLLYKLNTVDYHSMCFTGLIMVHCGKMLWAGKESLLMNIFLSVPCKSLYLLHL
jgi:hypothetical protein